VNFGVRLEEDEGVGAEEVEGVGVGSRYHARAFAFDNSSFSVRSVWLYEMDLA
jgi:hypothetical protein